MLYKHDHLILLSISCMYPSLKTRQTTAVHHGSREHRKVLGCQHRSSRCHISGIRIDLAVYRALSIL